MDINILLEPVEGDNPSGTELRNDPRFHAIERMLEPAAKAARVNQDGTLNPSSLPVDWDQIKTDGMDLALTGRDLRLLVILVRVAYAQNGFAGLAQGTDILIQSLDRYWDSLHPVLRDRDTPREAATPRINALKQIENDDNGLLGDLKFAVVLDPRGIGPITGQDLAVATLTQSDVQAKAVSGLSQTELNAIGEAHVKRVKRVNAATRALAAEDPDKVAAMTTTITKAEQNLSDLCAKIADVGGFKDAMALRLPEISEFLAMVRATLEAPMDKQAQSASAEPNPNPAAAVLDAPARVSNGSGAPGTITTRRDVEQSLDQIIAFYERTEPSSPIPHLARRMRRMVQMDFLELMEEIAPSGMKEFRSIAGVEDVKQK